MVKFKVPSILYVKYVTPKIVKNLISAPTDLEPLNPSSRLSAMAPYGSISVLQILLYLNPAPIKGIYEKFA